MINENIRIPIELNEFISGDLALAGESSGLVVFAHGSGSNRKSPRNRLVSETLNRAGMATLLLDLLTPREAMDDEITRQHRFDIEMLAGRVKHGIDWAKQEPRLGDLPLGLFGASTGTAAAIQAATKSWRHVVALVSRGGRPDLVDSETLRKLRTPALFLVGSSDTEVIHLNEEAAALLSCPHELTIVAGASHLFEEYGALEHVADHAAKWFGKYFSLAGRGDSLCSA